MTDDLRTVLRNLEAAGLIYKGDDGRWRSREDATMTKLPDGSMIVRRQPPQ